MSFYDEQLKQLQQKIARKQHLEAVRAQLRARQEELTRKAADLNLVKREEQADVDRLEGGSHLRACFR